MINITAVILCLTGCLGYGMLEISGKRNEKKLYLSMYMSFLQVKNLLLVHREIIECACLRLGEGENQTAHFYKEIGQQTRENYSEDFNGVWKKGVKKYWASKIRCKELYELLYEFPEYVVGCEVDMLECSLNRYLYQWENLMEHYGRKQRENEKLVFTVSLFAGVLVTILFI